jgi:hypothetical protein
VSWLYKTPLYMIGPLIVVSMLAALEVGRRLGRIVPVAEQQVALISAPILGLVALLLGFSYAMAGERYALRRAASVQEANSIETFWLRTALAPEPVGSEMRARVRRYVDVHFENREAGIDEAMTAKLEDEGVRLQREIWGLLRSDAQREPEARRLLLLTPALNAMIDDGASALAARENRIPDAILIFLALMTVVSGVVIGYRPPHEQRSPILWISFVVVLGGVLLLLLDLDRPRRGLLQADTTPYERLRQSVTLDPGLALAPKTRPSTAAEP